MIAENMTKAVHSGGFVVSDLKAAYRESSGLETVVIEALLKRAAELESDIARARDAMAETRKAVKP